MIRTQPSLCRRSILAGWFLAAILSAPSDALLYQPGEILMVVRTSSAGIDTGHVYAVDPLTGDARPIASGDLLTQPYGLTLAANGDILVVQGETTAEAVVRIDADTGEQSPYQLAITVGGGPDSVNNPTRIGNHLYVASGARIAQLDIASGESDVLAEGGFLGGQSLEPASGAILVESGSWLVRVDTETGQQSLAETFVLPIRDFVSLNEERVLLCYPGTFLIAPGSDPTFLFPESGFGVDRLADSVLVIGDGSRLLRADINSGEVEIIRDTPVVPLGNRGFIVATPPAPVCGNFEDDDGDGLSDWPADPGCRFAGFPIESPACDDGLDNDGDELIDGFDPECFIPSDRSEQVNCSDGIDNDGDGLTDTDDPGCKNAEGPLEEPQCNDGVDNDGDGLIDFADGEGADPECPAASWNSEAVPEAGAFAQALAAFGALIALGRRRSRSMKRNSWPKG